MSDNSQTTCVTQGAHIFGHDGKCVFCKVKRKHALDDMTVEQQKKFLADTFADSVLPMIDTVLRKRCEQWVEEIYNGMHKGESKSQTTMKGVKYVCENIHGTTFVLPDGNLVTVGFDTKTEERHTEPRFSGDPDYHMIRDRIVGLTVLWEKKP